MTLKQSISKRWSNIKTIPQNVRKNAKPAWKFLVTMFKDDYANFITMNVCVMFLFANIFIDGFLSKSEAFLILLLVATINSAERKQTLDFWRKQAEDVLEIAKGQQERLVTMIGLLERTKGSSRRKKEEIN